MAAAVPLIPAWAWDDTVLVLPDAPEALTDVLTGRTVAIGGGRLRVREALEALPVALLATG